MDFTNREVYLESLKDIKEHKINVQPSLIYQLLIKVNEFENFTSLIVNFDSKIKDIDKFNQLFNRLKNGEPFEYVVNEASFVSLMLYVDNNVLIPRVETEGLMNIVNKIIDDNKLNDSTIIDMCTGSGCIGLYMKYTHRNSRVIVSDISKEALKIAKKNSENLGLEIEVLESDKLDLFLKNHIKCDIFLSNPPYVERKEDIFDEVKKYEPMNAVFVENNDIFYEECFKHYKEVMNDKFLMAFEINYDQKERLTKLIGKYFTNDDTKFLFLKDIFGKDRYLIILGGYDVTYFEM